MELTFNELPQAISQLREDMAIIKQLLLDKGAEPQSELNKWYDLSELCDYLPDKPAKATIYSYVHKMEIPFHKGQKKLRFLKSEIDEWLKTGKRKTHAEIAKEADLYLANKKGGRYGR